MKAHCSGDPAKRRIFISHRSGDSAERRILKPSLASRPWKKLANMNAIVI